MVARYLVFAGKVFYPNGGMQDLHSSHDRLEDAVKSAENYDWPGPDGKWAEIFDIHEMKMVERFHDERLDEYREFYRNEESD